jgi:hypothetical protein
VHDHVEQLVLLQVVLGHLTGTVGEGGGAQVRHVSGVDTRHDDAQRDWDCNTAILLLFAISWSPSLHPAPAALTQHA